MLSVNEFTDEFKRVCDADFSVHGAQVSGKENYSENNYSKTMNSDPEQVLLQLSHVTHVYDPDSKESFPALNDVSLSIHKNEFIGIIGHTRFRKVDADPTFKWSYEADKRNNYL